MLLHPIDRATSWGFLLQSSQTWSAGLHGPKNLLFTENELSIFVHVAVLNVRQIQFNPYFKFLRLKKDNFFLKYILVDGNKGQLSLW